MINHRKLCELSREIVDIHPTLFRSAKDRQTKVYVERAPVADGSFLDAFCLDVDCENNGYLHLFEAKRSVKDLRHDLHLGKMEAYREEFVARSCTLIANVEAVGLITVHASDVALKHCLDALEGEGLPVFFGVVIADWQWDRSRFPSDLARCWRMIRQPTILDVQPRDFTDMIDRLDEE